MSSYRNIQLAVMCLTETIIRSRVRQSTNMHVPNLGLTFKVTCLARDLAEEWQEVLLGRLIDVWEMEEAERNAARPLLFLADDANGVRRWVIVEDVIKDEVRQGMEMIRAEEFEYLMRPRGEVRRGSEMIEIRGDTILVEKLTMEEDA